MSRKQLLGVTTSVIEISGVLQHIAQHIATQLAFSDFLRQILLSALELLLGMVNHGESMTDLGRSPWISHSFPVSNV